MIVMNGKTHILFALAIGLIFLRIFPEFGVLLLSKILFSAGLLFGSLFPDFDLRIGFLKHRGILHSVYILFLAVLLGIFFNSLFSLFFGFALGFFSHLIGDMITLEGIRPFYPLNFRIRGRLHSGGVIELLIIIILAFLILFF